jgi:hypothetical protein
MGIAAAGSCGLLGERLSVDIDDGRTYLFGDLDEFIGGDRRINYAERCGVGAVVLSLLSADTVGGERTGHDGGRKGCKQDKDRSEPAVAKPRKEGVHFFHILI